jgi:hypothetical protein
MNDPKKKPLSTAANKLARLSDQRRCPISLTLNERDCPDGVEKLVSSSRVFDVGVDEEGVDE